MNSYHNLHALRNYMQGLNATLRSLHASVGSQIRANDNNLNRISGGKPVVNHIPVLKEGDNIWTNVVDQLPRDILSAVLGAGRRSSRSSTGIGSLLGGDSRQSSGQTWADAANAIVRAMSRNL